MKRRSRESEEKAEERPFDETMEMEMEIGDGDGDGDQRWRVVVVFRSFYSRSAGGRKA